MLLTVHDELVFEAPQKVAQDVAAAVQQQMEHAFALDVPLKVDVGVGHNWEEC